MQEVQQKVIQCSFNELASRINAHYEEGWLVKMAFRNNDAHYTQYVIIFEKILESADF